MSNIAFSPAVRQNLLAMQDTAAMMAQTNNRLATGLKVSTAVDNPQSFFTAQGLNNRASDLSGLLDNMGLAVNTLNAASKGIDAIQKLVAQAKSTANQALQTADVATTLETAVTAKDYSGSGNSKTLTIEIGSTSTSITLTQNITSAGVLKTAISAAGIAGLTITESGGNISFSVASGEDLELGGTSTGSGNLLAGTVTSTNGEANRKVYMDQFNDLLTQIDELSGDASFNGVNLLQSGTTLAVNFNEDQSSKLDIEGVALDAAGLSLSAATNWTADSAINAVISSLDSAKTTLRAQATAFGNNLSVVNNRQTFTKGLIDTLNSGAASLTVADINEESAGLLALQTRQSLATTALSISNQSEQSVLRLF
jgi:flagellin